MVAPDFRAWPPTKKITPTRTLTIARTRRRRNRTKNSRFRRLPACASCHPPAPLARRLPEREWFDWRGGVACRRGRGSAEAIAGAAGSDVAAIDAAGIFGTRDPWFTF